MRRGPRLALALLLLACAAGAQAPATVEPVGEPSGFIPTAEGLLRFHARDLDVAEAFAQLRVMLRKNIVVSPDVSVRFTGDLYDLTLEEAVDAICRSTGLTARDEGTFIVVEPAQLESRIHRLVHSRAADLIALLQPLLSPDGKITTTAEEQPALAEEAILAPREEVLLVWDFPANQDRIARVIASMDVPVDQPPPPPPTEELPGPESRVFHLDYARAQDLMPLLQPLLSPVGKLTATQAAEQGITPSQEEAGGDSYAQLDVLVALDLPTHLERLAAVIATLDVRPRQVLIEATIVSAQIDDTREMGVRISALDGTFADPALSTSTGATLDLATGTLAFGDLDPGDIKGGTGTAFTNVSDGLSSGGLNVGFFRGKVGVFLKALETNAQIHVLATPKIVTLNKQRGEVMLGRRDGFLTSTTTQTSTTETVEFLETGTRLVYRPYISSDGYVRLEIHPEDSDGGLNAEGIPFEETAEVTTNVIVRSGETVVIGGLFREKQTSVDTKVPLLGDLPVLGALFRSDKDVSQREEIIILLTPHILDWDSDEGRTTAGSGDGQPIQQAADAAQLSGSYVRTARELMWKDEFGSAMILLDAARDLGQRETSMLFLRNEIGRGMLADPVGAEIDALIMGDMMRRAGPAPREEGP